MISQRSTEKEMKAWGLEIINLREIKIHSEKIATANAKITDDSYLFNTLFNIID
jgi:hypothetical protein